MSYNQLDLHTRKHTSIFTVFGSSEEHILLPMSTSERPLNHLHGTSDFRYVC